MDLSITNIIKDELIYNIKLFNDGHRTEISDEEFDHYIKIVKELDPKFNYLEYLNTENINKIENKNLLCKECECEVTELGCKNPGCRSKYVKIISNIMRLLNIKEDEIKLLETNIDIKTINELSLKYSKDTLLNLMNNNEAYILGNPESEDEYEFLRLTVDILRTQLL